MGIKNKKRVSMEYAIDLIVNLSNQIHTHPLITCIKFRVTSFWVIYYPEIFSVP